MMGSAHGDLRAMPQSAHGTGQAAEGGAYENARAIVGMLAGRKIRIVAATKGRDIAQISEALRAGITEIGENRVQEAMEKFPQLPQGIKRHMIGHLQSNKVKEAVALFDVIQSVDSMRLAKKISNESVKQKKRITIYLQVNISGKETQSGFSPGEIGAAAGKIMKMQSDFFVVGGVMAIAGTKNPAEDFRKARQICSLLGRPVFSAGMSGDFGVAIEEGSNMIRLGNAIFGQSRI